jgi:TetR/AcrR family transcriptional regulator
MGEDGTTHRASGARVPQQQRSRDTQKQILTGALAVFAERGFEGASMRLIAERAGIGQPLVVYHFPTKEDLWVATIETALGVFLDRIRPNLEVLEGLDPAIRLSVIFRNFTRFSAGNPELLAIMIDANRRGGPKLARVIHDKLRPTFELLRELIEAAQQAGAMPAGDPGLIYYSMVAVAGTVFALNAEFEQLTGRDPLEPDMIEAQASLLVRLFFPGLENAGGAASKQEQLPWSR